MAADADEVVSITKAAGFANSAEELKSVQVGLSDKELEGVAGGTFTAGMNCTGDLPGGPFTSRFHC